MYFLSSLCTRESNLERSNLNAFTEKSSQMTFCTKQVSNKQIPAPFAKNRKKPSFIYSGLATQNFWKSMFEWISQNFKDLENVSPSLSLCFGLIDDVKDLLFHHLLLIARHYIYTCRLANKLPKLQVYIQVLMNSIEIEKQIAFHNNDSNVFVWK